MIRSNFTDSEIVETLTIISTKPTAYSGQAFNFTALNDRVFEILLYQIFKARIETNDYTLNGKYDSVVLMNGVGERGRDCYLTKKGKNVGVIQCKQISRNLTKPDVLREMLKFVMHYILDPTLISDIKNFTYYAAASKGFAETATNLFADFNNRYKVEDIETYSKAHIKNISAFKNLKYEDISNQLHYALSNITTKTISPADFTQYLIEHDKLVKNFFRIMTVTDNSLLDGIIENYLVPILNQQFTKKDRPYIDFTYRFKEYLQRVYSYYSSSRTLVFGNQQKKLDDFYYPLTLICSESGETKRIVTSTFKYEDTFLPTFKKIIIVDNGGMGKSTIMKWLFLSVIKQRKGIPIFIELRKLKDKKTIIDEIILELNPIDYVLEREVVTKLIAQGNFIFFFDGYDEISDEDREFVTTDLQNFIAKSTKNLFIMTSRPETALITFSDFKEFKVKKLLKEEAFELIKKIGNNGEKSLRLIKKLEENDMQNIKEFLQSPLLVSLLYKKFEHRENIPLHLQEFFYDVFEALFQDHDLTKGDSYIRNKKTNLTFTEFFQVLRELGFYTLKIGEIEYNDAVLTRYLHEVSRRLPNIKFEPYDFIDDLVKAVPLFNKEGLEYRWSHKSFQEYFAAEFICRDSKDKQIPILKTMYESAKSEKYSFVFSLCYDIDYKPFRKAIIIPYLKSFVSYYESSFNDLVTTTDITPESINVRKILTFNKTYFVLFNKTLADLGAIMSVFNSKSDISDRVKVKGLPDFIPINFRLRSISMSDVIILTSICKTDLLDLLIKKNNVVLTVLKEKNSANKKTNSEIFSSPADYVIVNHTYNETNDSKIAMEYYNNLITNKVRDQGKNYHLDYVKCKKFIESYESEMSENSEDYFTAGF